MGWGGRDLPGTGMRNTGHEKAAAKIFKVMSWDGDGDWEGDKDTRP